MRFYFGLVCCLLMGCSSPSSNKSGCKTDTECKSDRICVDGECVSPTTDGGGSDAGSSDSDGDVIEVSDDGGGSGADTGTDTGETPNSRFSVLERTPMYRKPGLTGLNVSNGNCLAPMAPVPEDALLRSMTADAMPCSYLVDASGPRART
jgi:hypothetical protein